MENKLKLTIVYTPCEEGGFTAYIKEIRGVVSEGDTKIEARENVLDALALMLEATGEESELENGAPDKMSDELIILT